MKKRRERIKLKKKLLRRGKKELRKRIFLLLRWKKIEDETKRK